MKKTGIVILTIALIAAICGSFYVVNDKSKRANQKEKVLTEVQRITTKLFGDELAANNPKDTYKQSVTADYKIAADSDTETE